VAGGYHNRATGDGAAVAGGARNNATGVLSAALGGFGNEAQGNYSVTAGRCAWARHDGAMVLAASSSTAGEEGTTGWTSVHTSTSSCERRLESSTAHELSVYASGGVRVLDGPLHTYGEAGVTVHAGGVSVAAGGVDSHGPQGITGAWFGWVAWRRLEGPDETGGVPLCRNCCRRRGDEKVLRDP
jgi:hypothetical protein